MKSILRFVVFWRYLLLACLVLVTVGGHLSVVLLKSPVPGGRHPSSLAAKYEKIEEGMTEAQVFEILGEPKNRYEDACMDMKFMRWTEGHERIVIVFLWGETGEVLRKRFFAASAPESPEERLAAVP